MKIIVHSMRICNDGFADLCEAFQIFWDEDGQTLIHEDGFADLRQAFQLFWDEDDQDPSQSTLRELMRIVGLKEVKALFLKVKARVETAKRQGVDLSKERFNVIFEGNPGTSKTTITRLYGRFLASLGVSGHRSSFIWDSDKTKDSLTMKLPDYSDEELLRILVRRIHGKFEKKMKVEGGIVGLYSRILVRRIGRGRGKKNFGNVRALESAFSKVCDRQADRLHRERLDGKESDDFLLMKEDMIGHEPSDVPNQSLAWRELQSMVGLDEVKESIQAFFDRVSVNYHRELREEEPVQITLNRVFLGPPGTGKTTVGKLYGQILADLGLLSGGEAVVKNPSDFIGPYLGQSEKQTKSILEDTKGKVLIIDDAHMLYPGSRSGSHHKSDSYRTAVIDTLVAEIQNAIGEDRCVILMGYPEQMEEMFQNSNPGLARRFPIEEAFHFTDFDDVQLGQILDLKLNKQGLAATSKAKAVALEMLSRARYRPNFGNGAEVENLLSRAKDAHQRRISRTLMSRRTEGIVFEPEDFDANYDRSLRANENYRSLFKDVFGSEDVIAQFEDYQQTAAGMRLHGIDPRPYIPFAFVFKGPPGTGKTTTARKVGQIFYDMGFLSAPDVVECSASHLVAEYEGQTGPKVIGLLERALGKVLFIDEAYRLGEGQYAKQAVGELVDGMTKIRFTRKIIVILAGYEEDMNKLMYVNRGLRSRFGTEVVFHHMAPEDCLQLLQQRIGKLGIQIDGVDHLDSATMTPVVSLFAKLRATKSWANGRDVERLAERVIREVFKACARRNDALGLLTVSAKELVTFLESMLEKAEMEEAEMAISATPEDHPDWAGRLNNLGIKLMRRYERTGSMDDLNRAVDVAGTAVDATPQDHPDRAAMLNNLGNRLGSRFERTGSIDDLNRAVDVVGTAVDAIPQDHPDRATMLSNLGSWLGRRFERTGSIDDLNRAVDVAGTAVDATPQDHPGRATMLSNLGSLLGRRFERTGSIDDLNRAVDVAGMAVDATPQDHPDRATMLSNLGNWLGRRFERTGSMDDLNYAVDVAGTAVDATPQDHPGRAIILSNLGSWLGRRFERTGSIDNLNRAVDVIGTAVDATPQDHPDRAIILNNLGNLLGSRFKRTGSMDDLNRAVDVIGTAVDATPQDHPDRAGRLSNLGNWLGRRFERTGSMDDLNRAVDVIGTAVDAIPQDHPDRATMLSNLGNRLGRRFERTGSMDNLNHAVDVMGTAVDAMPQDHPGRATMLSNLGSLLGSRFERTGSIDDLNRAVDVAGTAVDATPQDHPNRASRLSNLGNWLGSRFKRTGSMDDLNRAVDVVGTAVDATPQDHPDRAGQLSNLGNWLGSRFEWTGSMDDLNRAVDVIGTAVDATPQDHPDRAGRLSNLGSWLGRRFERTGSIDDLNHAVDVTGTAVDATPQDHPDRATMLNNLGSWLGSRFERTGSTDDLNRAVDVAGTVVDATPQDHPDRATMLSNLGSLLGRRFERTGSMDDLNRAVDVAGTAVDAMPQDHPGRATMLSNLGSLLGSRFERTAKEDLNRAVEVVAMAIQAPPLSHPQLASLNNLGSLLGRQFERTAMGDLERSISISKEGWKCHNAPPSIRIRLARRAATLLTLQANWEESSMLLQDAVKLLPSLSPRLLRHTDKQHMLADFAGLASMAAATILEAGNEPHLALEALELGRGVIAGLLLETRTDITDLEQKHPELAKEFESLRNELDSPATGTVLPMSSDIAPPWETQAKRRREADQMFKKTVTKIRAHPEFKNFLLPPTADELMAAASSGPIVVVNVSDHRCDALLVETHTIRVLPLPGLHHSDIKDKIIRSIPSLSDNEERRRDVNEGSSIQVSSDLLEWLWDCAARPILDALGFRETPPRTTTDEWPHIWWIPTGLMSRLPLHAAGRHYTNSSETVLDRVVSSYSPSIKALVYARQSTMQKDLNQASKTALLVSMRTTPPSCAGLIPGDLRFAEEEIQILDSLLSPSTSKVKLKQPRKRDVLGSIDTCTIFHFAGHGISASRNPSKSCLLLNDWVENPLTVEDLTELKLYRKSPWLAYLSACSTGESQAENLQDEAIHLVSACQLAGFPHVVGSLWKVDDKCSVDAAREVYRTVRDKGWNDEAVALGVHNAARLLRGNTSGGGWRAGQEDVPLDVGGVDEPRGVVATIDGEGGGSSRNRGVDGDARREEGNPSIWAAYIHVGP